MRGGNSGRFGGPPQPAYDIHMRSRAEERRHRPLGPSGASHMRNGAVVVTGESKTSGGPTHRLLRLLSRRADRPQPSSGPAIPQRESGVAARMFLQEHARPQP